MNLVKWSTPEDQATGLLRFKTVPRNTLFLFSPISAARAPVLTTGGMSEPIRVVFLNDTLIPIRIGSSLELLVPPNENILVPQNTHHVVEASQDTAILPHLGTVRRRIM